MTDDAHGRTAPLLLTPGPTILPDEVRQALAAPMPHHREPRFRAMLADCLAGLREMLATPDVVLLSCSGRGGLEAALVNAFSPGDPVLACVNGHFGQMFARIGRDLGLDVAEVARDWERPVDPGEVREALRARPEIRGLLVVHSETSTGMLNDVAALGRALADTGCLVVVDGMSAVASVEIRVPWGLDAVAGCSQKGLMSPPGLAIVALSQRFREAMPRSRFPRSYWDFDQALRALAQDPPETHNTCAVPAVVAMAAALARIRREGAETVYRRQAALAARTRRAIQALGLSYVTEQLDDRVRSPVVTTVRCPAGIRSQDVLRCARERFGVMFQRGLGPLADTTFRIGHLGAVGAPDIARGLEALDATLTVLGVPHQRDAWRAVPAAESGGRGG